MQDNYFGFLDYRAAQRRLAAKFQQPRALLLHTLAFIAAMSAVWAYGIGWRLWLYRDNFILPMLFGAGWSLLLAAHALLHYRRSAAMDERRELAVEDEMRQFIDQHGDGVDDETLFATHRQFEAGLERQARWSVSLTAFAIINALSWVVASINMGTSWAFQMTVPLAVLIIGGAQAFLNWQQQRWAGRRSWFTRLPLRHIVAYAAGSLGLWIAGAFRMINHWDADHAVFVWGIVLLLHIVWSVAVWPFIQRVTGRSAQAEQPAKRKPARHVERLVLADDGEVLDIVDESVRQARLQQPRAGARSDR